MAPKHASAKAAPETLQSHKQKRFCEYAEAFKTQAAVAWLIVRNRCAAKTGPAAVPQERIELSLSRPKADDINIILDVADAIEWAEVHSSLPTPVAAAVTDQEVKDMRAKIDLLKLTNRALTAESASAS